MKCPLLILAFTYVPGPTTENVGDCLKEECAWWNEAQGICAVKDMAQQLGYISLDATQLLEKIVPEGKK